MLLLPSAGPNWKLCSPRCLRLTQHCAMMYRVDRASPVPAQRWNIREFSYPGTVYTLHYQGGGGTKTGHTTTTSNGIYSRSWTEDPEPHVVKCSQRVRPTLWIFLEMKISHLSGCVRSWIDWSIFPIPILYFQTINSEWNALRKVKWSSLMMMK